MRVSIFIVAAAIGASNAAISADYTTREIAAITTDIGIGRDRCGLALSDVGKRILAHVELMPANLEIAAGVADSIGAFNKARELLGEKAACGIILLARPGAFK